CYTLACAVTARRPRSRTASTFPLHDALPISARRKPRKRRTGSGQVGAARYDPAMSEPTVASTPGAVAAGEDHVGIGEVAGYDPRDRKSTRLNSSHVKISYAVFCLKKKNNSIK